MHSRFVKGELMFYENKQCTKSYKTSSPYRRFRKNKYAIDLLEPFLFRKFSRKEHKQYLKYF